MTRSRHTGGRQGDRRVTARGINVNVTLLFSLAKHAAVMDAYVAGLEERVRRGLPIDYLASVASFFSSAWTQQSTACSTSAAGATSPGARRSQTRGSPSPTRRTSRRALRCARPGRASPQRVLWASTGTKDARYGDVKYVEELAGRGVVNTMPPGTLAAFRDHGRVADALAGSEDAARAALAEPTAAGITSMWSPHGCSMTASPRSGLDARAARRPGLSPRIHPTTGEVMKRLATTVTQHPVRVLLVRPVALVALLALTSPGGVAERADVMKADQTAFLPDRYESVRAAQLEKRGFPAPDGATATIVVRRRDHARLSASDIARAGRLAQTLATVHGVPTRQPTAAASPRTARCCSARCCSTAPPSTRS